MNARARKRDASSSVVLTAARPIGVPTMGFMQARRVDGSLPPLEAPYAPAPTSAITPCAPYYVPQSAPLVSSPEGERNSLISTFVANSHRPQTSVLLQPITDVSASSEVFREYMKTECDRRVDQEWTHRIRAKEYAITQAEQEIAERRAAEEEAERKAAAVAAAIAEAETYLSEASRYTEPDSLWQALETGSMTLVRMTWLIEHAEAGGILPRRQDLPAAAKISPAELRVIFGRGNDAGVLPIVAVAGKWQSAAHPDPTGACLRRVAKALKREAPKFRMRSQSGDVLAALPGFSELGVFWPFASLDQRDASLFEEWMLLPPEELDEGQRELRDRYLNSWSEEEAAQHAAALDWRSVWYAHDSTTVLLLTTADEETGRQGANDDDDDDHGGRARGGTAAVTNTAIKVKLKKSILTKWRNPLLRRVFLAWRRCVNAAAAEKAELAEAAAAAAAAHARAYGSDGWTTYERCASTQLRRFTADKAGALPWKLCLDLDNPKGIGFIGSDRHDPWRAERTWPIGPDDFDALVANQDFSEPADVRVVQNLFRKMRMRQLGGAKRLQFAGMPPPSELDASRLGRCLSACVNCERIGLADVGMGDLASVRLFSSLGHGSLEKLTNLTLFNNAIGDEGCKALARAALDGAMQQLAFLSLGSNLINDVGVRALASALNEGALPALETLCLGGNAFCDAAREDICQACKNRGILCKKDRFGDALLDEVVAPRIKG